MHNPTPAYGPDGAGAYTVTWNDETRPYSERFYFRDAAREFARLLPQTAQNVYIERGQLGEGYPRPRDWDATNA